MQKTVSTCTGAMKHKLERLQVLHSCTREVKESKHSEPWYQGASSGLV